MSFVLLDLDQDSRVEAEVFVAALDIVRSETHVGQTVKISTYDDSRQYNIFLKIRKEKKNRKKNFSKQKNSRGEYSR